MAAGPLLSGVASAVGIVGFLWMWIFAGVAAGADGMAVAKVKATMAVAPTDLFQWRPFLAPFHAVVLHFPIGFVTMAAILELYRMCRPSEEIRRVTVLVLWLSLATGIVAAMFGTMRAGSGGYEPRLLELHRLFGIAVPLLTLATLALQKAAFRAGAGRGWNHGYRGMLGATTALLVVAGHYGGNLTHGSRYLTENAPAFVRDFLEEEGEPVSVAAEDTTNVPPALRLFVEKVQPAFAAKCIRCHGPEKQKGDYRMDEPAVVLKGGESGRTAIKPGAPLESHLVRLILLSRDDDSVMPPNGREPLSNDETMSIIRWIQEGAPFPGEATVATAGPAGAGQ